MIVTVNVAESGPVVAGEEPVDSCFHAPQGGHIFAKPGKSNDDMRPIRIVIQPPGQSFHLCLWQGSSQQSFQEVAPQLLLGFTDRFGFGHFQGVGGGAMFGSQCVEHI
jgi:hypothetical protein